MKLRTGRILALERYEPPRAYEEARIYVRICVCRCGETSRLKTRERCRVFLVPPSFQSTDEITRVWSNRGRHPQQSRDRHVSLVTKFLERSATRETEMRATWAQYSRCMCPFDFERSGSVMRISRILFRPLSGAPLQQIALFRTGRSSIRGLLVTSSQTSYLV